MTSKDLKLDQLDETYEVIGELTGDNRATRAFIAKRREDGADVLITVAQTPTGDEGNALGHLAADATLLGGLTHRNLLPIIEGRWLETEAFAVVTERVNAPTLEELLVRREEEFDYPRIATLLQEVNGVVEWARAQKVVHRSIDASTIHVEQGSDRVLVSFAVRPLPLADMPGADDDARTVATLAREMLTRSVADRDRGNQPLSELRPGLPAQVISQTEALLAPASATGKRPDVRGYIATIAMADALKRAEAECERMVLDERDVLAKEKHAIQLELARERDALALERQTLTNERAALEKERSALADAGAELQAQRDMYARTAEHATPVGDNAPVAVPAARRGSRRGLGLSLAAGALVLLIAVTLLAINRRDRLAPVDSARAISTSRAVESSAGGVTVEPMIPAISPVDVPDDLVSGVAARAAEEPSVIWTSPPRMSTRLDTTRRDTTVADTTRRADSLSPLVTPAVPVVPLSVDSVAKARRDSNLKRDSVRRDTLIRRPLSPS